MKKSPKIICFVCIGEHDFEIEAIYDYQPYEASQEPGYNHLGSPGCPASIEGIYDITCIDKKLQSQFDELAKIYQRKINDQIEKSIWEDLQREAEESKY